MSELVTVERPWLSDIVTIHPLLVCVLFEAVKNNFLITISVITGITLGLFFYHQVLTPKISFLDIGQGDSILVNDGTIQLLIDGGRDNEQALRKISSRMLPWDKTIELAVATHPDLDHIGGLLYILKYFHIKTLLVTDTEYATEISKDILKQARQDGTIIIVAKQGDTFTIGDSWRATVLWPDHNLSTEFDDTNDHSIVMRLDSKKFSTLLTGDASKVIENILEKQVSQRENQQSEIDFPLRVFSNSKSEKRFHSAGSLLDVDILKLGHHGSKTSSAESFLRVTSPKVAIISAGCNNSYGHPHVEVLQRLHFLQIPFLSTCDVGTITYRL